MSEPDEAPAPQADATNAAPTSNPTSAPTSAPTSNPTAGPTSATTAPDGSPSAAGAKLDGRRAALTRLALAAGGVLAAGTAIGPAGVALSPLLRKDPNAREGGWLRVDDVSRFVVGALPARVVLRQDVRDQWLVRRGETLGAVLVERLSEGDFRVLSSVCPHLGCSVVWHSEHANWQCPCHKSSFARDGALVPGERGTNPSPRALDPLEWRVAGGRTLEVRWVRFKTGIAERVAIGGGDAT